jgi:uncharacterized protein with PQ loop repeat
MAFGVSAQQEIDMSITEIIGWIGVTLSIFISVPQFMQSFKKKSTEGLSKQTYQLLFLTVLCYLIRAIAIKEPIFIASSAINLIITAMVLYLFKLYPSKN